MKTISKKEIFKAEKNFHAIPSRFISFLKLKKVFVEFPHHFLLVFCQPSFNNFCHNNLASSITIFFLVFINGGFSP